jgi:hypothetical protein
MALVGDRTPPLSCLRPPYLTLRGKADDVEEETGMCTPRNRGGRGPGTQGRIHRYNVGKVPPQQGLVATCRDSSNEA